MDDDGVLAVVNYRLADHLITFTHTEVPPQASIFTFPSDQILPAYKNRDPAASFASVAEFIGNAQGTNIQPTAMEALLASFYGAFDEEILMRLSLDPQLSRFAPNSLASVRKSRASNDKRPDHRCAPV
jgi:hypothetical protein